MILLLFLFFILSFFYIFHTIFRSIIIFDSHNSKLSYIFLYYSEEIASERLHVNSRDLNPVLLLSNREPEYLSYEIKPQLQIHQVRNVGGELI